MAEMALQIGIRRENVGVLTMRLIDIEPLIDECDELVSIEWNHKVAPPSWADAEEEFKQRLLDQPVIDPESLRPQGEWVEREDWSVADVYYTCSVCEEDFVTIDGTPADNLWNYCPNCGARMKGAETE